MYFRGIFSGRPGTSSNWWDLVASTDLKHLYLLHLQELDHLDLKPLTFKLYILVNYEQHLTHHYSDNVQLYKNAEHCSAPAFSRPSAFVVFT